MKKVGAAVLVLTLLLPGVVSAQGVIDERGLTEEQKHQLALQAEQMKKQNESGAIDPSAIDPQKLNEWVDLGENIGVAVAATAKELGVAADEFLNTRTGQITVVLIVWKVMGEDIVGIIGGTMAWIAITMLIVWSFKYFFMSKKVVNKESGEVTYVRRYEFHSSDARAAAACAHVGMFILTCIVCGSIVF